MNKYITEECEMCNGTGKAITPTHLQSFHGLTMDCLMCNGYGKLPNEAGKEIIELMNVFGKRKYIC